MDAEEEETGCPPLFEFASAGDAQALDVIAEAVLCPEDGGESMRCAAAPRLARNSFGMGLQGGLWARLALFAGWLCT